MEVHWALWTKEIARILSQFYSSSCSMRTFLVLVLLKASHGYYSQEVQFLSDNLNSYMGTIESQVNQLFPYWDQVYDSYRSLGDYASFGRPELADYVINYRRNYTDFALSGLFMVQQARRDIIGNWTFWRDNFQTVIEEADQAVKYSADAMRNGGCSLGDIRTFIFGFSSNMSNELSAAVGEQLIGYQYLYGIVGQKSLPSFAQLATSVFSDPYDPLYRLQQLEMALLEPLRELIRRQTQTLSQLVHQYFVAGMFPTLANLRKTVQSTILQAQNQSCGSGASV